MNIIRASIERPIAVVSAVLMVVMFGIVALLNIPIQLAPDVNRPVITVETEWFGAAPAEVEREIVNRQEDELRGLEGLEEMLGTAETGRGRIELEFMVGTDMDRALLLVANRLDRVGDYPSEVDQPTLSSAGAEDNAIAWLTLRRVPGNDRPIHTFGDFAEDVIKTRIERVPGVSRVDVYGGSEREMQVIVDPERLAHNRITISQVVQGLRAANASISAGAVEEGKRRYTVRTEGDFESVQSVRDVVLRSTIDPVTGRVGRLTVADIGDVVFDYKEPVSRIRYFGEPGMAMPIRRETGANVIETMAGVEAALEELSAYDLPAEGLYINKVYDETTYITSAIALVQQNIWVGGLLAAVVLMTFLRSGSATLVVSLAIPVSVVGSFVAMAALGRSINVISLAGLAFAVGMVVDAAIVVLENIFRLRQNGRSAKDAAYLGASQVWGAVLVSALTTVMVFIPILVMQLEVGQLFRDIAVAISVSVLLSLLVSVTVVPALASRLLGPGVEKAQNRRIPGIDHFARGFHSSVMGITRRAVRSRGFAAMMIIALTAVCSISTYIFLPKLDYLPNGNRNLVIGRLAPPPGYNLDTQTAIAGQLENATRPIWDESGERLQTEDGTPTLSRFFFVAFRANTIIGAAAADDSRVSELIPVLSAPVSAVPGTRSFFFQTSLFGRGVGGSGAVDLDISGGDMNEIVEVAQRIDRAINEVLPRSQGTQIRPLPSLTLGAPEVRLLPDRTKLADNGISALELGQTVDAFNDGLRVAEITVDGERIDLTLRGPVKNVTQTQGIEALPVVTEQGMILPAGSLAQVQVTTGPTEIRHRERQRTITLVVQPPASIALEESMEILRDQVIAKVVAEGVPAGVTMRLSGTASKLQETWAEMQIDLVMALAIVYLVMAILFESFLYPIIIVFSVPLATAGGMLGLGMLNAFTPQKLDMLTLLGFVILIGIVVNNAILLVHQTLHHLRDEGMAPGAAILEATSNRIRPIFMSTLTSVLGMLPLVVFPGAGSELYRGLGSVVVGGLALSAVLTLGLIPPMLSLFMSAIEGREAKQPAPAAPGASTPPTVGPDPKGAPAE
ncbi:efflux RND transporter permease subunit [Thalassobaculum sp. OXR-137]|uniref:efflux RND transporter permease subunit n=1 Tax=Thalassobaculum sp. OXR-137 TaxID=3100173 RepID=UPI002AC9E8D5|nr:efflux RND transporter permease subunit [Thalassobaculum sp. OXR-137]WPZ33619.1 efflux RND transporter permease subunit [Thalassobaculum sp. OXR-137]